MRRKGSAVEVLNHRFQRRMSAGVISEEILSNVIHEYIQTVGRGSIQLKSRKEEKKVFAKRGAPFGNTNRLKTGAHTYEMKQLRADVHRYLQSARALLEKMGTHATISGGA